MKKIFTSLAILAITTISALAQKTVDLSVTITSPSQLSTMPNKASGDSVQFVFNITNNGTAAVVAGDSLGLYVGGYAVFLPTNQLAYRGRLITGVSIPSGSSYTYSYWVRKGSYTVSGTNNADTTVNWFWNNDTNFVISYVRGWDANGVDFTDAGFDNSTQEPVDGGNNITATRLYILGTPGVGINDRTITKATALNVYPNPSNGTVSFDYNFATATEARVSVVDITGKQVYTKNFGKLNGQQTLNLDLSSLSNGIYTVEMMTTEGFGLSKITINK